MDSPLDFPTLENYKMLAAAIVESAAKDYVALYKVADKAYMTIEKFFRSGYFRLLMENIDPEYLIIELRRKARRKK